LIYQKEKGEKTKRQVTCPAAGGKKSNQPSIKQPEQHTKKPEAAPAEATAAAALASTSKLKRGKETVDTPSIRTKWGPIRSPHPPARRQRAAKIKGKIRQHSKGTPQKKSQSTKSLKKERRKALKGVLTGALASGVVELFRSSEKGGGTCPVSAL